MTAIGKLQVLQLNKTPADVMGAITSVGGKDPASNESAEMVIFEQPPLKQNIQPISNESSEPEAPQSPDSTPGKTNAAVRRTLPLDNHEGQDPWTQEVAAYRQAAQGTQPPATTNIFNPQDRVALSPGTADNSGFGPNLPQRQFLQTLPNWISRDFLQFQN